MGIHEDSMHCGMSNGNIQWDCLVIWWLGQLSRYSDSLRVGRSGDRIPVEARFSAPVLTGPGAHPVSCTMGIGSFLGVKRPGRGADHPTPIFSAEVLKNGYSYTSTCPKGLSSLLQGEPLFLLSCYLMWENWLCW